MPYQSGRIYSHMKGKQLRGRRGWSTLLLVLGLVMVVGLLGSCEEAGAGSGDSGDVADAGEDASDPVDTETETETGEETANDESNSEETDDTDDSAGDDSADDSATDDSAGDDSAGDESADDAATGDSGGDDSATDDSAGDGDSEDTGQADDTTGDDATGDDATGDETVGEESETEEQPVEEIGEEPAEETLDTSDMILHLSLDGELTDETGNTTDASIVDSVDYGEDRDGNASSAIELNGSGYVTVGDVDLSGDVDLTISAWIRDDGTNTQKDRGIVFYQSSDGMSTLVEIAMRIRKLATETWQDGSFEAFVEDSGSNGTRTTELVMPGSWTHIALVYLHDGGQLRLYQDGSLENSTTVTLSVDSGALNIGGGRNNEEFHGRIDDLAIFTRALSDSEIVLAKDGIGTEGAASESEVEAVIRTE